MLQCFSARQQAFQTHRFGIRPLKFCQLSPWGFEKELVLVFLYFPQLSWSFTEEQFASLYRRYHLNSIIRHVLVLAHIQREHSSLVGFWLVCLFTSFGSDFWMWLILNFSFLTTFLYPLWHFHNWLLTCRYKPDSSAKMLVIIFVK